MIERRHFLVQGHVQGVGFRAFVYQSARAHGICGGIRNLADGRVEILARAGSGELAIFASLVRQGPPRSRVDDVTEFAREPLAKDFDWFEAAREFSILEDGEKPWF